MSSIQRKTENIPPNHQPNPFKQKQISIIEDSLYKKARKTHQHDENKITAKYIADK